MKFYAALVGGFLFTVGGLSLPSASEARELPSRAISADAVCETGEVNGHQGFICQDGEARYFCTEPRTVCWLIIPPGPYQRGHWRAPSAAAAALSATRR